LVGQRPTTIQDIKEAQTERRQLQKLEWQRVLAWQVFKEQAHEQPLKQPAVEEPFGMPSEKITLPPSEMVQQPGGKWQRVNKQTIEERVFQVALMYMESYFTQQPPIGVKTATKSRETIKRTMEKTLNSSQVRYVMLIRI
jgi:hypothetical protein